MATFVELLTSTSLIFAVSLFFISLGAGVMGSILGLGGGVIIVPALTLLFGVNIRYAIGASLVAVIATSSGAAASYVKDRMTNIRVAMILEVATVTGALTGAFFSPQLPPQFLFLLFAVILFYSVLMTFRNRLRENLPAAEPDKWSKALQLSSSYPDFKTGKEVPYVVTGVPLGFSLMFAAGIVSALIGIGSGSLKVPAMDSAMKLPFKVSSATSNFMIGVTGAASAGVYYMRGDIIPSLAAPVALGVFVGAAVGVRLLRRVSTNTLRILFMIVLTVVGLQMLIKGLATQPGAGV